MKKSNVKAVVEWRRRTKLRIVEELGGCCVGCGYNKHPAALQCHHINPEEKEFNIGADGIPRAWERLKQELKKCVLLCANCHRKEHVGNPHRVSFSGKSLMDCQYHGTVPFYSFMKRGKVTYTCSFCSLERQRRRRRKKKQELVDMQGGRCLRCKIEDLDVLEFHHLGDKVAGISSLMNNNRMMVEEARKCIVLCANCHVEEHQ